MAMDTDGGAAVAPGALFAPGPAGAAERGSGLEVPPMVSRRVLDLATYLARHQGAVGRELVLLRVPTAAQQARALAAAQARSPNATLECMVLRMGKAPLGLAQRMVPFQSLPAVLAAGTQYRPAGRCSEASV